MTTTVTVDQEIANLCPKLKDHEASQLEDNLKSDGCRDPLVLWEGILLDGHNRYEICTRLSIPYQTVSAPDTVSSRADAVEWVIRNQLGRRNLTIQERDYLIGKRYAAEKLNVTERATTGGVGRTTSLITATELAPRTKVGATAQPEVPATGQSDPKHNPRSASVSEKDVNRTSAQIAAEVGVSEKTVRRAEPFARAIDILTETCGEYIGREIRDGKSRLSREKVIEIASLPRRTQHKEYRRAKLEAAKPRKPIPVSAVFNKTEPDQTTPPMDDKKYIMPGPKGRPVDPHAPPDMIDEITRLWAKWEQIHVEHYCWVLFHDHSDEAIKRKKRCHEIIGPFLSRLTMLAHVCSKSAPPQPTEDQTTLVTQAVVDTEVSDASV